MFMLHNDLWKLNRVLLVFYIAILTLFAMEMYLQTRFAGKG